ncbi:cyclophilin-like fold protein [Halorussus salinisoli]|uniref:cyclophilin-like fold protein n=1 Tax=Halorussus salinisoli TaxID=2558242 RepID=UPI0010C19DC7|nr:cyclophilin-like fold protein [Halorussus salinisoli]
MADLRIAVGDVTCTASWTDDAPATRDALAAALPVAGDATRWGDELYFSVPVDMPAENARETVPVGAVAYWPPGNALCLFWGPTPASTDDQPRAASPVTVVAELEDPSPLEGVAGEAYVRVEAA